MAKTKEKDLLIDQLLAKVEEKKKQIEKIKNPVFKTNLSFSMEVFGSSNRINLNVATEETLFSLLVYLESMIDRVNDIAARNNVTYHEQFNGYKLTDWYDDIILKIKQKQSQTQVSELKAIETKLNSLISEDKKKDIELQNLSKLLEQ
jgi:hypothetical protein